MFARSIRGGFQLWLAFLLIVVLSGFGISVYHLQRISRFKQLDEELQARVSALVSTVRRPPPFEFGRERMPFENRQGPPGAGDMLRRSPPPDFEIGPEARPFGDTPRLREFGDLPPPDAGRQMRPRIRDIQIPAETAMLFEENARNGFYYAIWSPDETLLKSSTNAPILMSPEARSSDGLTHLRTRDTFREAIHFTERGDCVLAGRSIETDLRELRGFGWLLLAAGGVVLALGLGGGWWIATRAIRPIAEISAAAERIAAGDLSQRIDSAHSDNELGRLAEVLNSTFARLDAAFARQRQFTADAAHELRTPLSVMLNHAQNGLADECAKPEHREAFEACQRAAQRMRRLTQTLLELARLDAGQESVERAPFDLAEQTRACVELIQPLAGERHIRISSDLQPAMVKGDAERIGQVVTNLLANAVQFNKDYGEIRVASRLEKDAAVLTVSDTGQGIAPEDLPHVFERFYRGDTSRGGANGHCGLGLAICEAIVRAHGGTIGVESQPGAGAVFTVRLPAAT